MAVETKRDFIKFIQDIAINEELAVEFLGINNAHKLADFFSDKGYSINPLDCEEIIEARIRMEGLTIPKNIGDNLVKIGPSGEMYPMERDMNPLGGDLPKGHKRWPWPCGPKKAY